MFALLEPLSWKVGGLFFGGQDCSFAMINKLPQVQSKSTITTILEQTAPKRLTGLQRELLFTANWPI
jgi:hypothetical protein